MFAVLDRVDEAIVRAERAVVAAMLGVMGLVVFLDVLHRVSSREDTALGNPLVVAGIASVVSVLAFKTRGSSGAVAKGVVLGVVIAGAQAAFVRALPHGLVWSQTLALGLTLWLGTIGASLAAYSRRHLALDIGSKLWPPAIAPKVAAVGHLATAAFCLGIFYLSWRSLFGYELGGQHVAGHVDAWVDSEHVAAVLTGTAIPKWAAMAAIPYGMAVLAFRFTLEAARTWTGRVQLGGDDTLQQLGITVEDAS